MWSLDWFAAESLALGKPATTTTAAVAGKAVRRAGWNDRWLIYYGSLWWIVKSAESWVVKVEDFSENEFLARDWTDQPFQADQCGATPAYNVDPPVYREWSNEAPNFLPPPIPGYQEAA